VYERILIANRGEVAARIARTCRRLGIETIGVHVESERDEVHVEACDQSVSLGADPSAYREIARIVEAARGTEVPVVHPGYGIRRDEAELVRALESVGIACVGPSAERCEAASDRLSVLAAANAHGIRTLPASERAILEPNEALAHIDRVGYPVLVKPVRGLGEPASDKPVSDVAELSERLDAMSPLDASGGAYLERWVERARHVQVQVIYDGKEALVLGEREVSVRREGRIVVAESPAPAIDQLHYADAVRGAMWDAACEIAAALGCVGLPSCHFVIDSDGVFYFTGFTAGLTVEHATTEMCSNLDLVELSLRLSAGESLPPEVWKAEPTGSAFCGRVDASIDPRDGRPFESRVDAARWPPAPQGKVRIETGVKSGSVISPEHDPMIASITTYAPTRHDALLMLDRILAEIHLAPVVTNLRLLRKAVNDESLRAGQYDDGFLDRI
jgi:acetyl/propionyl-CoA carboxylase alpha subunit